MSVDPNQPAHSCQALLDLHCPRWVALTDSQHVLEQVVTVPVDSAAETAGIAAIGRILLRGGSVRPSAVQFLLDRVDPLSEPYDYCERDHKPKYGNHDQQVAEFGVVTTADNENLIEILCLQLASHQR